MTGTRAAASRSFGNICILCDFRKRIYRQSIKSFQLLPCACELKRDIYFQKSPYVSGGLQTGCLLQNVNRIFQTDAAVSVDICA